jgi:hypothetical protein
VCCCCLSGQATSVSVNGDFAHGAKAATDWSKWTTDIMENESVDLCNEKRTCPICLEVLVSECVSKTRLDGLGLACVLADVDVSGDKNTVMTGAPAWVASTAAQAAIKKSEGVATGRFSIPNNCLILSHTRASLNAISATSMREEIDDRTIRKIEIIEKVGGVQPGVSQQLSSSTTLHAHTKCGVRQCWPEVEVPSVGAEPLSTRKFSLRRLPCHKTHVFHSKCIDEWLSNKNACPLCCRRVGVL